MAFAILSLYLFEASLFSSSRLLIKDISTRIDGISAPTSTATWVHDIPHRRIFRRAYSGQGGLPGLYKAHLEELSRQARIPAQCEVVTGEDFASTLKAYSSRSALVILGFKVIAGDDEALERLETFTAELPRVLFVNSAGDMNLEA